MAGDETRNLIDHAQSMVGKGKKKTSAEDLVAEAEALVGKGDGPPSTRQLVVEAEKLIGRRDEPKGKGGMIAVIVILAALGAAAAWFFLGRAG